MAFLLALGAALQARKGRIAIPVYLGDALQLNGYAEDLVPKAFREVASTDKDYPANCDSGGVISSRIARTKPGHDGIDSARAGMR